MKHYVKTRSVSVITDAHMVAQRVQQSESKTKEKDYINQRMTLTRKEKDHLLEDLHDKDMSSLMDLF